MNKLFEIPETTIEKEWKDMPEFIMNDLTSERKIIVHFRSQSDVKKFAEAIGQNITPKQPSLWFPEMKPRKTSDKIYIEDES